MLDSSQLKDLEETYGAKNYLPLEVVIARGDGVWVFDVEGNKYMDLLSGYSALNQGHMNPQIKAAALEQLDKLTLTSRAFRNDQFGLFCHKICELTGFEMVLPMNSGAEAVETAIKAARKWGYLKKGVEEDKAEIIVCKNNFHGRTITITGFSTEKQYRDGFSPFTPGFRVIDFGNISQLTQAITDNTVAFLLEPIQGEGGINIPPSGYLAEVAAVCHEKNVLLMLDEIQTGLGRTGKMFAYEHEKEAKPDVLIVGKALSGGFYPVSAVLAKREVLNVFTPGDHGSTFGGNPLAAAIAIAALDSLEDQHMVQNSAKMGAYFTKKLQSIQSKWIKDVRGRGLLIGIELTKKAGGARRFCEALMKKGILCKETHETIIRLAPPLIITQEQIDFALEKIEAVLES